ncbi:uncharacterized protein EV422DRAFT_411079 [Fimicolochytrium jonesii]|uniref:uncharacterized protein n=1 Tax=Fimicolochytrium jonesii TaxID=1396493 RepID=UPI0022FE195E|nr:uncharacterized protein EV422DRAFT_411079 [Fimicolochytrium jonesii]KAI8822715.1 hypothetical protein EV422DRAFT_411079 [Fimicolochytrium jonesii]
MKCDIRPRLRALDSLYKSLWTVAGTISGNPTIWCGPSNLVERVAPSVPTSSSSITRCLPTSSPFHQHFHQHFDISTWTTVETSFSYITIISGIARLLSTTLPTTVCAGKPWMRSSFDVFSASTVQNSSCWLRPCCLYYCYDLDDGGGSEVEKTGRV